MTHIGGINGKRERDSRLGLRQIELGCFADPKGGLCAHPKGVKWAADAALPAVPNQEPGGKLQRPGFKVMHVLDIDYMSSALTLTDKFKEVVNWSEQHPRHVPIFILLELKEDAESPELNQPIRFRTQELSDLETEIESVIPRRKILALDDVRLGEPSLPSALRKNPWPKLDSVRGKIIFAMDNEARFVIFTSKVIASGKQTAFCECAVYQPSRRMDEDQ